MRPLQLCSCTWALCGTQDTSPESTWGRLLPFPPSLLGKLRASISLLIALIRDRGGVNWKTLVLCLFGKENVNKN